MFVPKANNRISIEKGTKFDRYILKQKKKKKVRKENVSVWMRGIS